MKGFFIGFCPALVVHAMAWGDVLPTGFPGTFQDLPRETRIEVLSEGYRPFEDMQVYQPITITEEQEMPVEEPQPTNNPPAATTPATNPVPPPTTKPPVTTMPTQPVAPTNPVSNPITTPTPLPPANPVTTNPTPRVPGSPVRYTPGQTSTTSDSQVCSKHTNNDATIIRTISGCNKLSDSHKTRCTKCVKHAGTYENGRCFIEILHWFCQGTGWSGQDPRSCPDNYKYQGCSMIRKYVDAEQPFTCPQEGALSGCCQHGEGTDAEHPPFNIDGDSYYEMNCKMPLSSNLDWRVPHSNGSAILVSGVNHATRNWCMPNSKSGPWNSHNHQGKYKHCAATISGGTTIQQWHKIN